MHGATHPPNPTVVGGGGGKKLGIGKMLCIEAWKKCYDGGHLVVAWRT